MISSDVRLLPHSHGRGPTGNAPSRSSLRMLALVGPLFVCFRGSTACSVPDVARCPSAPTAPQDSDAFVRHRRLRLHDLIRHAPLIPDAPARALILALDRQAAFGFGV